MTNRYFEIHHDRRNLLIHALTAPLFMVGTLATVAAVPTRGPLLAVLGVAAMVVAFAAQGLGHRFEATQFAGFRGPLDVVRVAFREQWFAFPRYVLTGGFARAWRGESVANARRDRLRRVAG